MYAIYGNIYHQYTPVMLAYIPAPWILWVMGSFLGSLNLAMRRRQQPQGVAAVRRARRGGRGRGEGSCSSQSHDLLGKGWERTNKITMGDLEMNHVKCNRNFENIEFPWLFWNWTCDLIMFLWSHTCRYHHAFNPLGASLLTSGFWRHLAVRKTKVPRRIGILFLPSASGEMLFVFHDIKWTPKKPCMI